MEYCGIGASSTDERPVSEAIMSNCSHEENRIKGKPESGNGRKLKKNDEHEQLYLPEFILDKILVRLPVESVFKCKCVCKRWLSLVSTFSFVHSYCLHRGVSFGDSSAKLPWTLLYRYTCGQQFNNVPCDRKLHYICSSDSVTPQFSVLLVPFARSQVEIISASHGLLLCGQISGNRYYVCNPITKQSIALPPVESLQKQNREVPALEGSPKEATGIITVVKDGSFTRYRAVIPKCIDHNGTTIVFRFYVFCSISGKWMHFEAHSPSSPTEGIIKFGDTRPFELKGSLHWPLYYVGIVFAYDPYGRNDKCIHVIKLPRVHNDNENTRLCGVSGGCLQYYEVSRGDDGYAFNIWELKDYDGGEWSIKHTSDWDSVWSEDDYLTRKLSDMRRSDSVSFIPVAFHPFDPNIIYLHNKECIVSYSISNRRLDLLCYPMHDFLGIRWWTMLPFVLPSWPTLLPKPIWKASARIERYK